MNIAKLLFSSLLAVFMLFFCFSFSVQAQPPPEAPPIEIPQEGTSFTPLVPLVYNAPDGTQVTLQPGTTYTLYGGTLQQPTTISPEQYIIPTEPTPIVEFPRITPTEAVPTTPTVPTFPQIPTFPTIPEISPYGRTPYAPQYPAYPTYQAYEYPPTQAIQPQPVVVTGEGYFQNIIKDIQDLGISPAVMHGILAGVISLGIGSLLFYFSKSELVGLIGMVAGISISAVIFSELLWIAFLVGMVTIMGITIKIMK
jgi:hypothetical protein